MAINFRAEEQLDMYRQILNINIRDRYLINIREPIDVVQKTKLPITSEQRKGKRTENMKDVGKFPLQAVSFNKICLQYGLER